MRATYVLAAALPFAALLMLHTPAYAAELHDLAAIDREVAAFTGVPVGGSGGAQAQVDRQMRLARCSQPLALDYYGARTSIRVVCPDAGSWRVFVPLMQARGEEAGAAVVSRRDLLRVEAGGNGFRVSRSGEALEDGRAGAMIRVRINDGSRQGRVIAAEVIEAGRVRVPIG